MSAYAKAALIAALGLIAVGCTAVRGDKQKVTFRSEPTGALVSIAGSADPESETAGQSESTGGGEGEARAQKSQAQTPQAQDQKADGAKNGTAKPDKAEAIEGVGFMTPFDVVLKRNTRYHVTFAAPGYDTIVAEIRADIDPAGLLPVALPAGSVMMATDTMTGANRAFSGVIFVELPKIGTAPRSADGQPVIWREFEGRVYTPEGYELAVQQRREALKRLQNENAKRPGVRGS